MGWLTGVESTIASEIGGTKHIVSYAPASGEVLGDVPIFSAERVREAMTRARAAQALWSEVPLEERCERILTLRDTIVDRAEELVELLSAECGKPRQEALVHEVMVIADLATYYAKRATKILAPREIDLHLFKHRRSYVHYAPRGVIGVISPWNFPLVIPVGDAIAALIAGNAVLLKPSEVTPLIALKFKEIFDASGMPKDLLQVVTGDGSTGAALIDAHPDKVVFTGAVATGRRVAAACGENLIPCTLELGGKAAAIICEDADLERAARAIVFAGFANSGQICIAVERVYAHGAIHDALVERVVRLTRDLRQGDPRANGVDVGAMIFPRQLEVLDALVKDALAKGAELRTGGRRRPGRGQFYEPTVLTRCNHEMRVMRDEIFGPIVPIMSVASEEEAIAYANDSHLGLMGYVFTRDRGRGRAIAERVHAGTVMVNDVLTAYACPEAPFGGVKDSGYGRVHGDEGLRSMCEVRHVNYNRVPTIKREPVWFPYRKATYATMSRIMRVFMRSGSTVKKVIDLL
jgi:succinate-semialdehyde dehydrogenase/glutarate-semialdehyde dehydrogenase